MFFIREFWLLSGPHWPGILLSTINLRSSERLFHKTCIKYAVFLFIICIWAVLHVQDSYFGEVCHAISILCHISTPTRYLSNSPKTITLTFPHRLCHMYRHASWQLCLRSWLLFILRLKASPPLVILSKRPYRPMELCYHYRVVHITHVIKSFPIYFNISFRFY